MPSSKDSSATWLRHCAMSEVIVPEERRAFTDGAQALEAWAWVERHVDDIDIRGNRSTGDGWVTVVYNDGNRAEGATVYAAVLDAMEKEGKG